MNVTIEQAALFLNTSEKALKRFIRDDVFNPGNSIAGWISLRPGKEYGALVIDTVNESHVLPQVIWGMPKLHYPFGTCNDGSRQYTWPKDALKFQIAEKWDGTNICHYAYMDNQGIVYRTFKTRLTPIAGNGDLFGNFADLVKLALSRQTLPEKPVFGMSAHCYELCGYRNPHLVKYNFDIKLIPLCSILQKHGEIIPYMDTVGNFSVDSIERLTRAYEVTREADNQIIQDSNTEQGEFPLEGKVFYVFSESQGWMPMKCKPQIIEDIHWSRGGIPEDKIREACFKALERFSIQEISESEVEEILLEDFHQEAITCSTERIRKALDELRSEGYRRLKIWDILQEQDIEMSEHPKGDLMRMLSKHFPGSEMRRVFSSARAMGLVKER